MSNYLFLLLLVACPLMMVFMMRGKHGGRDGDANSGHGGHGHAGGCGHGQAHDHGDTRRDGAADTGADASLEELRRQREQLDREIEEREAKDDLPTPVGRVRR